MQILVMLTGPIIYQLIPTITEMETIYWLWPAWELYDTISWDLAGGQMAETSSDDEGYNKDWDLECLYNLQDK